MQKTPFVETMQRVMTERGITQSDLARMIWGKMTDERGYEVAKNRQVLGKYLAGTVKPRMTTVRKISKVLDVPVQDLVPESDPLKRPGSGIYLAAVDLQHSRIRLDIVAPNEVAASVVTALMPYAK